MRRGDPRDALLSQILPDAREHTETPGYVDDPLLEEQCSPIPGVLHKYARRLLVVPTYACAIHCRFCFRRTKRSEIKPETVVLDKMEALLQNDPTLTEVILSGGDPLILDDDTLAGIIARLEKIPHLARLRIHTRVPVVLPSRVTKGLQAILKESKLRIVISIHANHPKELDRHTARAVERLLDARAMMLCQSVLLKGINDRADTLVALCERLAELRVIPYYLHLLDKVKGVAHFDTPESVARALQQELRERLPGYLVPRIVREKPTCPYKLPL
jgi:EF-P beta-lysylation protein EpmB